MEYRRYFRETRDKILEMKRKGVLCVDMEATALMTVADYRCIGFGMLITVSDELHHENWRIGWRTDMLEEPEKKGIEIVLDTLVEL